jgi:hypothetical protein
VTFERQAATSAGRPLSPAPRALAPTGVLALQRTAGNTAVRALLRRAALQRRVGWTGVDPKSWNADVSDVPGARRVKRIPVEGITRGHASGPRDKGHPDVPRQDDAERKADEVETGTFKRVKALTSEAAGGVTTGRAVVLIPQGLAADAATVEVLFHLHGFTPGGRGRGGDGAGEPEDVATARIGQQLETSGRPMIAILPQGAMGKDGLEFWPDSSQVDVNAYIDEALGLVPAKLWPGGKPRAPGGVVVSAHSGGGDQVARMLKAGILPATGPRTVQGLLMFDALHGWGPAAVASFLTDRLDTELARLHGIWTAKHGSVPAVTAEAIADDQVDWIRRSGFRFHGFASTGYFKRYDTQLKPPIAAWFTTHAAELGGADSSVFKALSANYLDQAAVAAGTTHERIMGGTVDDAGARANQHLLEALAAPPAPKGKRVPAQPATTPAPVKAAPTKPAPAKAVAKTPAKTRLLNRDPKTKPPPTAGWAGVAKGSTNAAPRITKGTDIRRVPVKHIAAGRGSGNALVLIPDWLPAVETVEVLLHLHGHEYGSFPAGYPGAEDESLYRFEQALDQFSTDKKRPIIGILPQGGTRSQFGHGTSDFNAGVYIQQAIAAVPPDQWPSGSAPAAGGVILSGHSGAGGRFATMFGTEKMPGGTTDVPGHLEAFFSFDTINGKDGQKVSEIEDGAEYKAHRAFVLARLDADLQMLQAAGAKAGHEKEPQVQASLAAKLAAEGFRFRGFYRGSPNLDKDDPTKLEPTALADYADRYFLLKGEVDAWFDAHAADLGGKGSKLFTALRANYTIEPSGTDHMHDMGGLPGPKKDSPWTHENMRAALGSLPTVPQAGP